MISSKLEQRIIETIQETLDSMHRFQTLPVKKQNPEAWMNYHGNKLVGLMEDYRAEQPQPKENELSFFTESKK